MRGQRALFAFEEINDAQIIKKFGYAMPFLFTFLLAQKGNQKVPRG